MPTPEVPLMFTTLGNVPAADLEFMPPQWEIVPGSHIKLTLTWRKAGIVVRQDAHVHSLRGVTGQPVMGSLGGPPAPQPSGCPAGF